MQEEFHGNGIAWGETGAQRKLLYVWNSLTANIWLPSLSELVGTTGPVHPDAGTYVSAMQGLNTSTNYHTDAQGGSQFSYFKQFNQSDGGIVIMNACKQAKVWLRSTPCWSNDVAWRTTNEANMNTAYATASNAVHPAVGCSESLYSPYTLHKKKKETGRSWGRRPCRRSIMGC